MTDLAITADITNRLGRALTASEALRLPSILKDASAAVRNYTHQEFTLGTTTERLRVRRGTVRLPQRPVVSVASVVNVAGGSAPFQWDGLDTLCTTGRGFDTFGWEPFLVAPRVVDVTYTHGYNPIPDDIIGVVCSISIRALGRKPEDAGLTSESIAGYSYSIGAAGAAGGFGMLQDERNVLDGYLRVGGVIWTGP